MSTTITAPAADTTQDWHTSLPEDIRGDESLKNFKDVPSLAKSYTEAQKLIGSSIRMPKADAPAEEWDKFHARLGRPEAPDKYEFKRPQVPEGVKYDEELETAFKGMAHKAGLNTRQAQALLESYNAMQLERVTKMSGEMEAGVASLKKEWGQNYDKQIGMAQRAVKDVAGKEVIELLDSTGLGNHPAMIKFFANLGAQMGESAIVLGETSGAQDGKEAIQSKIQAILNDKKGPYWDVRATPKAHEEAMSEMAKLQAQLAAFDPKE